MQRTTRILMTLVAVGGMALLGTGCESDQSTQSMESNCVGCPDSENPNADHPNAEHPKGEHPNAEHPKADHPG